MRKALNQESNVLAPAPLLVAIATDLEQVHWTSILVQGNEI